MTSEQMAAWLREAGLEPLALIVDQYGWTPTAYELMGKTVTEAWTKHDDDGDSQ